MKLPTPTLKTTRFVLRKLTRDDPPALFPAFSDAKLMRWWSRGPFTNESELADWLVPKTRWKGGRSWAIADSAHGPAIGRIAVMDRGDAVSEVGYLIIGTRHGQGIARETLTTALNHLILAEERRRIFADVDPDNAAPNRLLESLGFTLEGRLRQNWTTHIGRRDSFIWGLLHQEWIGGKERSNPSSPRGSG